MNTEFREGKLSVTWEKPYDALAESIESAKKKGVAFDESSDAYPEWYPVLEQVRPFCWNPDPDEVLQMDLRKYHFPNGMPRPRKVWEAPVRT